MTRPAWLLVVLCSLAACARRPAPDASPDAASLDAASLDAAISVLDSGAELDARPARDSAVPADVPIPDMPSYDEYAALFPDLYCEMVWRCASSSTADFFDVLCPLSREPYVAYRQLVEEGRVAFDPAAAAACLRSYVAGCDLGASVADPGPCGAVLRGLVADGEPCTSPLECGPDSQCTDGADTCGTVGVCTPLPREGEACAGRCALGLLCESGACASLGYDYADLGEACDRVATTCESALDCRSGVCVDPSSAGWPGLGERCTESRGCSPDLRCDEDGWCVLLPALGEACAVLSRCAAGAYCDGGVCRERAERDGPCSSSLGCPASQRCVDGTCGLPRDRGEPCTGSSDCWSGRCEAGVCVAATFCF